MTMKKRLFYSNLLMVVLPLVVITILVWVLGAIARNIYFSAFEFHPRGTDQDSFWVVQSAMEQVDICTLTDRTTAEAFAEMCQGHGYKLYLSSEQDVLFQNLDSWERKIVRGYLSGNAALPVGQLLLIQRDDWSILCKAAVSDQSRITLIALRDESWPTEEVGTNPILAMAVSFITIIVLAVISVVFISLLLAHQMVKKITAPLELLYEGAVRIQNGDLDQDIPCAGTDELSKVCASFNEMQHQLKKNIEKNTQYEKARNEMLAGISHDLRTPLTSIKSYVKGILDGVARTPEKQAEYLTVVYRKSNDMEGLINQLFLFSKLETGDFPFRFQRVSIKNYVCTWLDTIEADLMKRGATVSFESDCTAEQVLLDSEQMNRVLMNIVENSLKYNGGIPIHISVGLNRSGHAVDLHIKDNGIGVSNEKLDRIFDSFYRGDESRGGTAQGSGLGLSIAKRIVMAHGGEIHAVASHGLEIIITLPLTED